MSVIAADDWSPPTEVEEYHLLKPLGRGAMGQVFLAHDTLLDRKVAVKFIVGGAPDPALREQFFVEARAIARLSHPNVVAIHRVGEVRRRPYLVSEFVHGMTLAELPRPVPAARLLEIGVGLSRGLAAAHRRGVLHRDLKPANAMITDDGEVKLLDFGLAKLLDRASASRPGGAGVDDGRPVGSPLYMAPEIWRGEPATPASDVYSVGVFLYELAAGRAPHVDVAPSELPRATQERDVPSLQSVAPGGDARLGAVIDRCLRRDPTARPQSGDELREALEALVVAGRAAVPAGNPYRGLAAFDSEHQALFFGRDVEARAIVDRLRAQPFVVVTGDSGVGKSSLCRAGVLPRLEGRVATFMPGSRPLAALCATVAPLLQVDEAALATQLRDDPSALARSLRPLAPLTLFVDQIEELATLAAPEEAAVAAEALAALTLRAPGLRLVASARSDFLTRLAGLPALGVEIARSLHLLPALSRQGVRDATVGPAEAKGFRFETPAMVDALVAVADEAGGLPLLQFALAQLWEERDVDHKRIPAAALERMGGPAGALARHADGVLVSLVPAERTAAQRMLLELVTAEGTRARKSDVELVRSDDGARAALEALVRGRLVVARADGCEIAHEALVAHWDTLRGWLSQDVERRAIAQRLERAAAEWERLGRVRDALWSGKQLAELASVTAVPSSVREEAFLAASEKDARRQRRLRWTIALAVPLTAFAVIGGIRYQRSREIAGRVAAAVAQSATAAGRARAGSAEFERLRAQSFARFDALDADGGEKLWQSALAAATRAGTDARAAGDALEMALRIDPGRADVRAQLGDRLLERALLAEATFQRAQRDDILPRLALNDDDGTRRARWNAPGTVELVAPAGAAIELYRYDDVDGRRNAVAMTPPPTRTWSLAPGSYLAVVGSVRAPFTVARGEQQRLVVLPPPADQIPAGFVYIPAGRFQYGGSSSEMLRVFCSAPPLRTLRTDAYLIARDETTYADWIAFLEALPPAERARRLPHAGDLVNAVNLRSDGGTWTLELRPRSTTYRARWGEPIRYRERERRSVQDWRRMPVSGVSYHDAEAYATWLSSSGRVPRARLCSEHEWERAARGADDREYPHGDRLDPDDANIDVTYGQKLAAFGPDEVGQHPVSRSPFGVDDLVGNIFEWTRSSGAQNEAVMRGANFYYNAYMARTYFRETMSPDDRTTMIGVRICADAP
jgi:formylglycine-generating enzyme required for sulfatase activity